MTTHRLLPLALLLFACSSSSDTTHQRAPLVDGEAECAVDADCTAVFPEEGGQCCAGTCVDCWADSDGDGELDCTDPDIVCAQQG